MKSENDPFSFEHANDSPGFLLWQVTSIWQREIRKALDKFGITHSQFVLLASIYWLSLQKKDVTQVLLSAHTKIDPMTTSTVLRTLQTKGYVRREAHATDTRAKSIALTEEGKKLTKLAVKTVEKFDDEFFAPLGSQLSSFNKKLVVLLQDKEGKRS